MTLAPLWRTRLFAVGAAIVAVWLAVEGARGDFFWPSLAGFALAAILLARWQPLPLATLLLGLTLAGYVIGNRGFAQISLSARLPLLPAEVALLCGGSLLLVQSAWRHELPFRRDPLNLLLLSWILLGCLRIVFDVEAYGLVALRDFAMVYYAAFFFLGQAAAGESRGARFLENILLFSCAVLLPVYLLHERFPNFFFNTLTLRGNPIIYYKDDLAGTLLAVGAVLFFLRFEARGRRRNLLVSLMLAAGMLATGNRASMAALFVATAWLLLAGRWRFAAVQAGTGALAAIVILLAASALNISWEKTPVFGAYERVVSLADPTGQRTYRGNETFFKGDNNLFRWVWWHNVIDETITGNPYVGLGFGRDLADRFVREYYPESGETFSTRSPHNVLLTIFARMGAIGLLVFLGIIVVIACRTWHAVRAGPHAAALWCAVWVLLTSACFGVVLEGPMGAVVFWTILGVAHGSSGQPIDVPELVRTVPDAGALPAPSAAVLVPPPGDS